MTLTRRAFGLGSISLLAVAAASGPSLADFGSTMLTDLENRDDFRDAVNAYIFGYPLVTMEYTRLVTTNVATAEKTRGPMGTLIKLRSYPDASFTDVTAPNADTLYTTGWFDVGEEPWVLDQPDMGDRYFLLPMLSGWTDVFEVPGSRTTGGAARTFLITGPSWSGSVPEGMTQLKAPTSLIWLLGRIYCTGTPEDYDAVHKLQDAFKLQPLSTWGKDYTPPEGKVDPSIDMKSPPREQVNNLPLRDYFALLAELMKTNPPAGADAPMVEAMARIGLVPGQDFDGSKLDDRFDKRVPQVATDRVKFHLFDSNGDFKDVNGWLYSVNVGVYGTDYVQRALITALGLGANRPQDAIYPSSRRDAGHMEYHGSNKYVMKFEKGQTPPVKGFWSLTMYNEQMFFVANPINRYSMSVRTNPVMGEDGSLTIYIQNESPGKDLEANWLPAPKDKFNLMLRMYWPSEEAPSLIDGSWKIPAVTKV